MQHVSVEVAGQTVSFDINKWAKLSDGSAVVRCGDTVLLVTANAAKTPREGTDFMPLTMEYIERSQAAGKIPGGFFKREGRPSEKAILTARIMDRPIRPLMADGFFYETQVVCTVLSSDSAIFPDTLALTGASFALCASDIPLTKPLACVRIGKIAGELKVNPSTSEMESSELDLVVASTDEAIVMVEGGAAELPESEIVDALMLGFDSAQPYIEAQKKMMKDLNIQKRDPLPSTINEGLVKKVSERFLPGIKESIEIHDKRERSAAYSAATKKAKEDWVASGDLADDDAVQIGAICDDLKKKAIRRKLVDTGKRIGDRTTTEIRHITSEVGVLPRTHGSALFNRGETSALVVATLGTGDDEQRVDALEGEYFKRFMLHYNFPPFSVGEARMLRSPGRREIGHGALAERSVARMMPSHEDFPYTVRIVSDILESNGSSSMATICGASLALMDAGVPIKRPVAGIAMGLIQEDGKFFRPF